ncbi:hypothetical protein AB0C50_22065 [Micromonospora taraxaci]|uniref:hypothetical protein n=1 Tax=Micromonospora taraxaci TaxID=1316803 RepID=UPI0033F897EB
MTTADAGYSWSWVPHGPQRRLTFHKRVARALWIGLNTAVITMEALIKVPAFTDGSPPWPVVPLAPGSWLVLNAGCADDQVGLFVAALADPIEVQPPGGRDEVVNALLAEELLIAAGGLQVRDSTTGTVVTPGCCAGLEDWRDWTQVLPGTRCGWDMIQVPRSRSSTTIYGCGRTAVRTGTEADGPASTSTCRAARYPGC